MRSGSVNLGVGLSRVIGINGYDWSAVASNNIWGSVGLGAYYFAIYQSDFTPSGGPTTRNDGFPVRCLASGA